MFKNAVQEFYSALNRGDIDSAINLFHPDIERIEFEGTHSAGRFKGLDELREHIETARTQWAEGACTPTRLQINGDKVIAFVRVKVRLKGREDWAEGNVTDVFKFKDGKIIVFRTFAKEQEALDWVAKN